MTQRRSQRRRERFDSGLAPSTPGSYTIEVSDAKVPIDQLPLVVSS